jgi:hypothetical protein
MTCRQLFCCQPFWMDGTWSPTSRPSTGSGGLTGRHPAGQSAPKSKTYLKKMGQLSTATDRYGAIENKARSSEASVRVCALCVCVCLSQLPVHIWLVHSTRVRVSAPSYATRPLGLFLQTWRSRNIPQSLVTSTGACASPVSRASIILSFSPSLLSTPDWSPLLDSRRVRGGGGRERRNQTGDTRDSGARTA